MFSGKQVTGRLRLQPNRYQLDSSFPLHVSPNQLKDFINYREQCELDAGLYK